MSVGVFLPGFTQTRSTSVAFTASDLSDLLEAVKAGEMTDKIRTSLTRVLDR